jgi:hypothetical protein
MFDPLPGHFRTQLEHEEWEEGKIHTFDHIVITLTTIILDEAEDYDVREYSQQTDNFEGPGVNHHVEEHVEAVVSGTDVQKGEVQIALYLGF